MPKWVFILIILVFAAAGTVSGGLALAVFSPFLPATPGYAAQRAAEQALMMLTVGPERRAYYALDLLDHRAAGLRNTAETTRENAAELAFSDQLSASLDVLVVAPVEDAAGLRNRLLNILGRVRADLAALPDTPARSVLARRVETLDALAADRSVPLAGLRNRLAQAAAPTPAPVVPTEIIPPAPVTVAPHPVQFPPGSAGAEHLFFPLQGRHAIIDCAACHPAGKYSGNDRSCGKCHTVERPDIHYPYECDACHGFDGWLPAHFNHAVVEPADCQGCHLDDRPVDHYPGQCSACHAVTAWLPATFDHAAAGAVDCAGCHLSARPANHFFGQCSMCHSTATWAGAHFNHSFPMDHGGANGVCTNCHAYADGGPWSCLGCHSEGSLRDEHDEDINSLVSRCLACHPSGSEGDDD